MNHREISTYLATRQAPLPAADVLARDHALATTFWLCARNAGVSEVLRTAVPPALSEVLRTAVPPALSEAPGPALPVELVEMILAALLPATTIGAAGLADVALIGQLQVSGAMLHAALAARRGDFVAAAAAAGLLAADVEHVEHAAARGLPVAVAALIAGMSKKFWTPATLPDAPALYAFAAEAAGQYLVGALRASPVADSAPDRARRDGARAVIELARDRAELPTVAVCALLASSADARVPAWRWPPWRAATAAAIYAASAPAEQAAAGVAKFADVVNQTGLSAATAIRIGRVLLASRRPKVLQTTAPDALSEALPFGEQSGLEQRARALLDALPLNLRDFARRIVRFCSVIVAEVAGEPVPAPESRPEPDADWCEAAGARFYCGEEISDENFEVLKEAQEEFLRFLLEVVEKTQVTDAHALFAAGKRASARMPSGCSNGFAAPRLLAPAVPADKLYTLVAFYGGIHHSEFNRAAPRIAAAVGPEWLSETQWVDCLYSKTASILRAIDARGIAPLCTNRCSGVDECLHCFDCAEQHCPEGILFSLLQRLPNLFTQYMSARRERLMIKHVDPTADLRVICTLWCNGTIAGTLPITRVAMLPPRLRNEIAASSEMSIWISSELAGSRNDPYWKWIHAQLDQASRKTLATWACHMSAAWTEVFAADLDLASATVAAKNWRGAVHSAFIHELRSQP